MRCGCANCDGFMVNDEGRHMGCVCPNCGYRCQACLGTDSVIAPDALASFRAIGARMNHGADDTDDFCVDAAPKHPPV